jgi:hypothetical protein
VRIGFWFVPSSWMIRNGFVFFEIFAWTGFVVQAIGSFLLLRLDWEQRWYLISDRSLRVREGIRAAPREDDDLREHTERLHPSGPAAALVRHCRRRGEERGRRRRARTTGGMTICTPSGCEALE